MAQTNYIYVRYHNIEFIEEYLSIIASFIIINEVAFKIILLKIYLYYSYFVLFTTYYPTKHFACECQHLHGSLFASIFCGGAEIGAIQSKFSLHLVQIKHHLIHCLGKHPIKNKLFQQQLIFKTLGSTVHNINMIH